MKFLLSHKYQTNFFKIISSLGIISIFILLYTRLDIKHVDNPPLKEEIEKSNLGIASKKQNYEIIIENSIFEGVNKYLEPYKVTAHTAVKTSDNKYKLNQINANYPINTKKDLLITSKHGTIYDKTKSIKLKHDVKIFFEDLILNSNKVEIDLANKEASSNSVVDLLYKNSRITADGFISKKNSDIINFKGHVMTRIYISDFKQ